MRIGVLVTGDTAVRAAHSLVALPDVSEVVVIGPATSKSFEVVETSVGCDVLIGHGPGAIQKARGHDLPLIWDGNTQEGDVAICGANAGGLTLALAAREADPRLVAVAHPDLEGGNDQIVSFPKPVGRLPAADSIVDGKRLAKASSIGFGACLVEGAGRSVAIVDDAAFMSGVALAAGIAAFPHIGSVWDAALPYLQAATAMGLVMAEDI